MADYPRVFKQGSFSTRVYRVKSETNASGWAYTVAWSVNTDGTTRRKLKQFAVEQKALDEARAQLNGLAAGSRGSIAGITLSDVEELRQARSKALAMGLPLIAALDELAALRVKMAKVKPIKVGEAWVWFMKRKAEQGIQAKKSYGKIASVFLEGFRERILHEITADEVHAFWVKHWSHPVTWNTNRKRFLTMFKECQRQGWLPKDQPTAVSMLARKKEDDPERGIITPEQADKVVELIRQKQPRYLPALALALYCGMRRAEVHAQLWKDIDLEHGHLNVTKAKPGTPQERPVAIPPIAKKLLETCSDRDGRVCPNVTVDRIRDIAQYGKNRLELPENCFRHSYITYLVAKTQNIPHVALQAGTSVAKIHKHYNRPKPQPAGYAFFGEKIPKK